MTLISNEIGVARRLAEFDRTRLGRHMLSVRELDRTDIDRLFELAALFRAASPAEYNTLLRGRIIGTAFYQPSTRTRLSFESAAIRLGASCIGFADPKVTRAGDFYAETIEDVVAVVSRYVDCLVLRHHDDDAGDRAARVSVVPIVSAGIGYREHPTQALGDVWSMAEAVGGLDGAVVGLIGDVAIRSLRPISMVLSRFKLKRLLFLRAPGTEVPAEVVACLAAGGIDWGYVEHVRELLAIADVIETIGIRHPQHNLPRQEAADEAPDTSTPDRFRLTRNVLEMAPRVVPILHPGGRKDELSPDVDGLPHARYWDQIANNLWMRVAILATLLTREDAR